MPGPESENLEKGYTTGTCASVTTKAGLMYLLADRTPDRVNLELPAGETATLTVDRRKQSSNSVTFATEKDAGDDPDVTDGAIVQTTVTLNGGDGVTFKAGPGVGRVTRSGLPVEKGEPAINPVPRSMMKKVVETYRDRSDFTAGVTLTVDVENGRELAERTLNPRLGIVDGLSILGTTGIVEPYSHASYIASIEQGIDVAVSNALNSVVLSTGGRTEKYAQERTELPDYGYVQFAGYLRETLLYLIDSDIDMAHFYFMPGKFSKFAQGNLSLHSKDSSLDVNRLIQTIQRVTSTEDSDAESLASLKSVNQIFSKLSQSTRESVVMDWIERIPLVLRDEFGSLSLNTMSITVLNLDGEVLGEGEFSP